MDLARALTARGFELLSTGGTARTLTDAGLSVINVSDVTGFPEMMDGRVKTLHPHIHGGILARRANADDVHALARLGIQSIDLVVVNLYPFVETARKPGVTFDELVEQIDIGGPSLVRAAAKNFEDVLVVVDPADYPALLSAIDETPSRSFRFDLMRKALKHTAEYDAAISATLARVRLEGDRFERSGSGTPGIEGDLQDTLALSLTKIRDLRYGENPHQKAAWYRQTDATGLLGDATILQGKELSFTNLLDLDAAARIVLEFDEPAAAVIKHTNPCGAATGESVVDAYLRARDADALAAYGGIVGVNRTLDVAAAEAIAATFIEAVIAPSVDAAAIQVLARKPKMRVVTASFDSRLKGDTELRSILGAVLRQERDRVVEAHAPWTDDRLPDGVTVATRRRPTAGEWEALRFAWRICAHVKSNTVVFTDARRTLAIGAGQMSRVDAVNTAVMKAGSARVALTGSVAASDAYFPFRDGLDAVAAAGATAVVQPGGSVRDAEVIAAADQHGLAMVFTGRRHFRH